MSASGALRPVGRVLAVAGAALLGVFVLAGAAAAQVSAKPVAAGVYTRSAGRLGAW